MDKYVHIVCHDIPYPADYGGVMNVFYTLKELHRQGIKIILHCFQYGNKKQSEELNQYCEKVFYYNRLSILPSFSFKYPYIVSSRANEELLENLNKDQYPILLEGIHCTWYLHQNKLTNRKIIVRLHNVEFIYYKELSKTTSSIFKKIYYRLESRLLKKYEQSIASIATILAVSKKDEAIYKEQFNAKQIHYLSVFTPFSLVNNKEGMGNYCLYHGNLSVPENEKAAEWLLKEVFNDIEIPLVIAGKNPSKKLTHLAHKKQTTCMVENPSQKDMQELIAKAHINILPSFDSTGIKLKLLNALFNGKHCVVNEACIEGSGLDAACHVAGNEAGFKSIIAQLYRKPFTDDEIELRQGLLQTNYNNEKNAQTLINLLW